MKILIVGATCPTGLQLVAQAIASGHQVTAGVRRPDAASLPSGVHAVRADVLDAVSLIGAVAGQDCVISSLGTKIERKPTTLLSDGTRNLIAAMQQTAVARLICITGVGAGDSRGHGGFFYDRIFQPLLLKEVYKDKDRQEAVVHESALDWTLVRPGVLSNGAAGSKFRALTDLTGITLGTIPRADVAAWILAHLADRTVFHQTVNLG
jgi:putative NADH-flavin reductase